MTTFRQNLFILEQSVFKTEFEADRVKGFNYLVIQKTHLLGNSNFKHIKIYNSFLGNNENTEFIIVDKHAKPGGHWNDAYQFVTLHQPASNYGVNSKKLGEGRVN